MGRIISTFVIFVLLIWGFLFFIATPLESLQEQENNFKKEIGKPFVLSKDTLLIIKYSLWRETFTLSNGKEINSALVLNKN